MHIKGAKCIELSCQRNDAEKSTGPSTCWGAHLLQQTTEELHACATYLYMCTCWCMHSLQQTTEKLLDSDLTLAGSTTYDCNTYIKSHWYLWLMVYTCKNPRTTSIKLERVQKYNSSLPIHAPHTYQRCHGHFRSKWSNISSTTYSTNQNVIQPRSKPASPIPTNSTSGIQR